MKKKHWIFWVLFFVIASLIVSGVYFNSKKGEKLTKDLKEHIIPIKTTKVGNAFDDLMPLKSILKDKKIIGMG